MEEALRRKAVLTLGGAVRLPQGYELPVRVSHSTADGSDTYSVTVTLQTTGARTLAALEQYGFDLDSLLTQAQAQLKERQ